MIAAWALRNWRLIAVGLAVVAVIASYVAVYRYGYAVSSAEWETKTLTKSVEVLRQRRDTNVDMQSLDDPGICRTLGGVWDNDRRECL